MLRCWSAVAVLMAVVILQVGAAAQEKEIAVLASNLSARIAASGKKTIAVVDMGNPQTCVTKLGRYISEELAVGLLQAGSGYVLVNRVQLQKLLTELKLGQSGLTDPATAKQLGKLAGADALVVGTMTFFGDTVRVTVQLLDTETAATVAASGVSIPRTAAIDKLADCVDAPLAPSQAPPATPAPAASARPTARTFQNGLLLASVESFGFSESLNNSSIALTVAVDSKTSRDESVLCPRPTLLDDRGGEWQLSQSSGLARAGSLNYVASSDGRVSYGIGDHTTVSPNERQIVSMRFIGVNSRSQPRPSTVSLTMECYRRRGEWDERFSIAISDIPIRGQ